MNILVVGDIPSHEEFKGKFKEIHPTVYKKSQEIQANDVTEAGVIFDFTMKGYEHGSLYQENRQAVLFINSVKTTLLELQCRYQWAHQLAGFNGLPGMFNRTILEVTLGSDTQESSIAKIFQELDSKYLLVTDRVGMVTPRVLCMIINEAYYTVLEGTACREDIDKAMKLGTNYPAGPFEFSESIGIQNVYEVLEALYADTKDERYKICPGLKKSYLQQLIPR